MKLLMDTHIWLWLMNGDPILTESILEEITQSVKNNCLFVSAISVWEIAMLQSKERIQLTLPCLEWVQQSLAIPGLNLVPLSPEIAVESTQLPGLIHGDPADRIIIATGRVLGATLITKNHKLIEYGQRGYLDTLALSS